MNTDLAIAIETGALEGVIARFNQTVGELRGDVATLRKEVAALADLVACNPTRQDYVSGYPAAAQLSGFTMKQLRRFVSIGAIGRGAETSTGGKIAFSVSELRALRKRYWIKAKA